MQHELRVLDGRRSNPQLAAMGTGDSSRERQAQTEAGQTGCTRAAKERLERALGELTFPGAVHDGDAHGGAVELGADGDGAAIAVLRGVVEEVGDDA